MARRVYWLPALLVVSAALAGRSLHGDGTDPQPSQDFLQDWAKAWEASDVDEMMAFYDSTETTTAVESLGRVRTGPAEIRKMYEEAFAELVVQRVTLAPIAQGEEGSAAWATCRFTAEIRLKSDNSKHVLEALGSFVLKRQDKAWRIVLEHFSTIPDVPRVRPAED